MSSVFISYARDDQAFVRELVAELAARENEAWVDWEGIPPTAEWWEEIKRGIEGADAFLFVLTPDSAKSAVCRSELDHAVALNKRIVPVLRLNVEDAAVPEAVASRQWITFLESVSISSGTDDLVDALDLDLEWLHGHTRWLVEALDWERSDRDGSTLARRRALAAAEAWLATGAEGEKEPPPSPLHYDYILASRRAATRRQRTWVAIVLAALVVSAALTAAALLERGRAVSQRRLAVSRGLLQAASGEAGRRIDRQMLLTIESYRHDPTVDARSGLVAAVQRAARLRRVLGPFDSAPDNLAITRSGGRVVVATRRGTIYRRGDFEEATSWRLPNVRSPAALSRDGALAAAASRDGISVWRLGAKHPVGTLHGVPATDGRRVDEPIAVETGKQHRLLLVTRGGQIVLWNSSSGATLDRKRVLKYVAAAAADSHGEVLAVAGSAGLEVIRVNRRSDRLGRPVEYDSAKQRDVSVAPSGNIAAAVSVGGDVVLWDLRRRRRIRPLQVRQVATTVDFSSDGRRLAVGDADGGVTIWTLSDREPATTLDGHGDAILDIAFTESELATSSLDGTVDLWTLTRVPYEQELTTGSSRQFRDVEYSSDSHWLAAAGYGPAVTTWDLSTSPPRLLAAIGDPHDASGETSIDFGSSKHLLAVATNVGSSSGSATNPFGPKAATGGAYFVDLLSRRRRRLLRRSAMPDAIAYADSAPIVAWPRRGRRISINPSARGPGPSGIVKLRGAPNDLAIDAEGNVLAAATNEGLELFKVRTRQPLNAPAARTSVNAVAFSSDEERLFAATDTVGVVVWDVHAGRLLATLPVNRARDVAITPDGKVLAAATENGAVRLWDIAKRRSLGNPFDSGVWALSFSPDGRHLVSAGGTVRVWDSVLWSEDAAQRFLCLAAGHNLARGDWARFLPGDRYRKTCA